VSAARGSIAGVEAAEHIAALEADGPRLAASARRAGWDAGVPGLDWTVRELVVHTGGIHRWAADVVRSASERLDTAAAGAVGTGPPDDELLDWFLAGHAALLDALRGAPADLVCASFLPAPSSLAFWCRRQAHETAIHRADAEAAAGAVSGFGPAFAQDGIDEVLRGFAARRRRKPAPRTAELALRCTDGTSWAVRIEGESVVAGPHPQPNGELLVTGSSAELYLWLWNRPSRAHLDGDETVAQLWRERVQVRWSS
jgi:uncharacterized protein (TIGR03083 family)